MYKLTIRDVRSDKIIVLQLFATSVKQAAKKAYDLLIDELGTAYTLDRKQNTIKIYDTQGLHYIATGGDKDVKTDRWQALQCSGCT